MDSSGHSYKPFVHHEKKVGCYTYKIAYYLHVITHHISDTISYIQMCGDKVSIPLSGQTK